MMRKTHFRLVFNLKEWEAHQRAEVLQHYHILSECVTNFRQRQDGLKQAQDIVWVTVITYSEEDKLALILKYGDRDVGIPD